MKRRRKHFWLVAGLMIILAVGAGCAHAPSGSQPATSQCEGGPAG